MIHIFGRTPSHLGVGRRREGGGGGARNLPLAGSFSRSPRLDDTRERSAAELPPLRSPGGRDPASGQKCSLSGNLSPVSLSKLRGVSATAGAAPGAQAGTGEGGGNRSLTRLCLFPQRPGLKLKPLRNRILM